MVGNDVSQRFLYLPDSYQYGDGGYYFGQNVGNKMPGASEVSRSNPDAKWETAVKAELWSGCHLSGRAFDGFFRLL